MQRLTGKIMNTVWSTFIAQHSCTRWDGDRKVVEGRRKKRKQSKSKSKSKNRWRKEITKKQWIQPDPGNKQIKTSSNFPDILMLSSVYTHTHTLYTRISTFEFLTKEKTKPSTDAHMLSHANNKNNSHGNKLAKSLSLSFHLFSSGHEQFSLATV